MKALSLLAPLWPVPPSPGEMLRFLGSEPPAPDACARIAAETYAPRGLWKEAAELFEKDFAKGSMSGDLTMSYAVCLLWLGRDEEAVAAVEAAYAGNPCELNGHSRLAREALIRGETLSGDALDWTLPEHLKTPLESFKRDFLQGRCKGECLVEFAETARRYANLSGEADRLELAKAAFEEARKEDPSLPDYSSFDITGFSVGQVYRRYMARSFSELYDGRSSQAGELDMVERMAFEGFLDEACALTSKIYGKRPSAKNGLSRAAWAYLVPRFEFEEALRLIDKDRALGRIEPFWLAIRAALLSFVEGFGKAEEEIRELYKESRFAFNAFSILGSVHWQRFGAIGEYLRLATLDVELGRANSFAWKLLLPLSAYASVQKGRRHMESLIEKGLLKPARPPSSMDDNEFLKLVDIIGLEVAQGGVPNVFDISIWRHEPFPGGLRKDAALSSLNKLFRFGDSKICKEIDVASVTMASMLCSHIEGEYQASVADVASMRSAVKALCSARRPGEPLAFLEIGSLFGGSSALMLQTARNEGYRAKLSAVDPFAGFYGNRTCPNSPGVSISKEKFEGNLRQFGFSSEDWEVLQGFSSSPAIKARLAGRAFDMLFIDGDHTCSGAFHDWRAFSSLIKPGGLVAFHDYCLNFTGVVKAIDEIRAEACANGEWEDLGHFGRVYALRRLRCV